MKSASGNTIHEIVLMDSAPAGLPHQSPALHQQEVDIEDLLRWAYQNQSVESVYWAACKEFQGPSPRPGSIGRDLDSLQTKVDTQRSMGIAAIRCAPDALTILDAVQTLAESNPAAAKLITHHARTGGCPYWWPEVDYSIAPDRHRNGRVIIYGQMNEAGLYEDGAFCPLLIDPDPTEINMDRADYSIWHNALQILVEILKDQLEDFSACDPSRAVMPWQ